MTLDLSTSRADTAEPPFLITRAADYAPSNDTAITATTDVRDLAFNLAMLMDATALAYLVELYEAR